MQKETKILDYKDEKAEEFFQIIEAKANDVTRENANMNADTPSGMMIKFASETSKKFVDDFLLTDEVKEAIEKRIYLYSR